jgi:2-hydroxychromene-2-carboxylate isomerase
MARKQVRYFFAFPSPFAALADGRIDDLVARAGAELIPIPIVPPPASPPTGLAAQIHEFKMSYLLEDAARSARKLGVAWNPPRLNPTTGVVDSTDAVAGYYYAREHGKERAYRNAVFRARWSEGRDIADRTVLAACASGAGLASDEYLAALDGKRYHGEIASGLVLCLQERIFGVPIFVVDGKRFWGNDRVDFLIEELRSPQGG